MKKMKLRWEELRDDVVAEFAARLAAESDDEIDPQELTMRLKKTLDYEVAMAQFRGGASDRVVKNLLLRGLDEVG